MARPIWSGSINFGLVTIPVRLYSATEDHTVHFNQFQRGTSDRIRYQRVNERTGKEVDYADIVKGHDVGSGQFVIVEPDELAAIAPGRSRTIDIETFVDLADIDPIHFQKTYWLAPAKPDYARPYSLLAAAMERTGKVGIASFVMRGKQYLTALRADDDVLAVDTLFYADEIRQPHDVLDTVPEGVRPRGNEVRMAESLIESMSGPWRPKDYRDTFTRKVHKLIKDKHQGREIVTEAAPPEATEVVDLAEALRRSVEGTTTGRRATKNSRSTKNSRTTKSSPGSGGRSKSGARARRSGLSDVDGASKSELVRMARKLDIKGRSRMSRGELAEAIQQTAAAS
jgi:DNA end-binding protein Ku